MPVELNQHRHVVTHLLTADVTITHQLVTTKIKMRIFMLCHTSAKPIYILLNKPAAVPATFLLKTSTSLSFWMQDTYWLLTTWFQSLLEMRTLGTHTL
jgi:hypothetical protein